MKTHALVWSGLVCKADQVNVVFNTSGADGDRLVKVVLCAQFAQLKAIDAQYSNGVGRFSARANDKRFVKALKVGKEARRRKRTVPTVLDRPELGIKVHGNQVGRIRWKLFFLKLPLVQCVGIFKCNIFDGFKSATCMLIPSATALVAEAFGHAN